MKKLVVIAVLPFVLFGSTSTASANKFAGECQLGGTRTVDNSHLAGSELYLNTKGTCTGALNGKMLSKAPVALQADAFSFFGSSYMGRGNLTFVRQQRTIEFATDIFGRVMWLHGDRDGSADGILAGEFPKVRVTLVTRLQIRG